MQCVLLEIEEEEIKKAEKIEIKKHKKCFASIGTSEWEVTDVIGVPCETVEFVKCPRLRVWMKHELTSRTLQVKTV